MPLQLEALPALYGDSLLLHYGTKADPGLIVIDGGPKTVYTNTLRPRLAEIKASRSPDEPLPIRLIVVSHIDEDHIKGILDLAAELDEGQGEPLVAVQELWHNSFTGLLGDAAAIFLKKASGAAVASVGQGRDLHDAARKIGWVLNDDRELLIAGVGDDTFDLGGKLKLQVLGPSNDRLVKLQQDWVKQVKAAAKKAKGASAADYEDTSPPNLASLVVYATDGKKKILLTGDGRGDFILEGIENAKLMKKDKFPVDILKVPHHGSIRDLEADFFERIPAKDYVISANGKFANPDLATLDLLLTARGNDAYNVHLTYPVDAFDKAYDRKALQKLVDGSKKKKYKIIPRDPKVKSVVL
jgi:hypothetical protein